MSKMICSICGNAFEREASPNMPFCSRRCQQIDLARWLGEEYRMPLDGHEDRENSEATDDDNQANPN